VRRQQLDTYTKALSHHISRIMFTWFVRSQARPMFVVGRHYIAIDKVTSKGSKYGCSQIISSRPSSWHVYRAPNPSFHFEFPAERRCYLRLCCTTIHNVTDLQSTCSNLSWGHFYTSYSLLQKPIKKSTWMWNVCWLHAISSSRRAPNDRLIFLDTCNLPEMSILILKQPQT